MKKSLIYTSIAALTLLISSGLTLAIGSANATNTNSDSSSLVAVTSELNNTSVNRLPAESESVYTITDTAGTATKTFVGNTLSTTDATLPVELQITYSLNDSPISTSDLAGQSGHVKLTYHYTATISHQGKLVPFLTVTGLQLDGHKFSNIKLSNGKIISEQDDYLIAGYSFVGLNADFNTDLLPDTFTIEADVTDFELSNAYTFATNEIFAELDVSKLSTIDGIVNSIGQLDAGINQILDGATQLDGGIDALAGGINQLQTGTEALNAGAHQLANGLSELSGGAHQLSAGADQLSAGLTRINAVDQQVMSYITPIAENINTSIEQLRQRIAIIRIINPALAAELAEIITQFEGYYDTVYGAVNEYASGVATLTDGASQLSTGLAALAAGSDELSIGASQLAAGTSELKDGAHQLATGTNQLSAGSKALKSGIATFKSEGIDRLVSFAQNDLANFTANARATINAAGSYHYYQDSSAKSVKFIFKTPSIK